MNIFIDTVVKGCNIALFDRDEILAYAQEPIERGHAEAILPLFQKLIHSINKTPQDIENIYVTIGPGSFTGLRVGLTVAQFMGFSLQKPVHGVTSFQSFSCGVEDDRDRLIVIETKRSDFYCQRMNKNHEPLTAAQSIPADQITISPDIIITGDAVERLIAEKNMQADYIAQEMISIPCVIDAIQNNRLHLHPAEAFYARDADVSTPKAKKEGRN